MCLNSITPKWSPLPTPKANKNRQREAHIVKFNWRFRSVELEFPRLLPKIENWFTKNALNVVKLRQTQISFFPSLWCVERRALKWIQFAAASSKNVFYCCSLFTLANVCEIRFDKLKCEHVTLSFKAVLVYEQCQKHFSLIAQTLPHSFLIHFLKQAWTTYTHWDILTEIKFRYRQWLCKQVPRLQLHTRVTIYNERFDGRCCR